MSVSGWGDYSPIQHIASAVWLNHEPETCWMTMWTAYYDASGDDSDVEQPLVAVGVVSSVADWLEFEREWDTVLRRHGAPYLHMSDLAHWKKPYATWKEYGEAKRRPFLEDLIGVIERRVAKIFVDRIIPRHFKTVNDRFVFDAEYWQSPYGLIMLQCTSAIEVWVAREHPGSPLHHVVEKGDGGQNVINDIASDAGTPLTVIPKKDPSGNWFMPFQASDLVAYEHRKAIRERLEPTERGFRGAFRELFRRKGVLP